MATVLDKVQNDIVTKYNLLVKDNFKDIKVLEPYIWASKIVLSYKFDCSVTTNNLGLEIDLVFNDTEYKDLKSIELSIFPDFKFMLSFKNISEFDNYINNGKLKEFADVYTNYNVAAKQLLENYKTMAQLTKV